MLKTPNEPNPQTVTTEPPSQDEAQTGASSPVSHRRSVTPRALLLGLVLLPLNAYWIVEMEFQRFSAHPTTVSLFFNCIFFLVLLTGLNSLVGKFKNILAIQPRRTLAGLLDALHRQLHGEP